MQDYKFRQTNTSGSLRRSRRGSPLIRVLILVLSLAVLALIAISIADLWPEQQSDLQAQDSSGLIPLPLPPQPETSAE